MGLVWDYLTSDKRLMTQDEIKLGRSVFGKTIRYGLVFIADDLGAGDRPWTEPSNSFFVLHLGPNAYASTDTDRYKALLVHELTHVWQGQNGIFTTAYVANSAWHQVFSGSAAYKYTPGKNWSEYNVEQQASIVEDWYSTGMSTESPLYRYIRDIIRNPSTLRAFGSFSFHGG